jgi:glycosyltransferase involved in cell wall biosynthesis
VVNTHALGAHALMARLGRLGVRRYVGLHLVERGGWGQPLGNPHTALAYEHAYDGALVISAALRDWCEAQGWPAGTLHLVRNAPGHPTPPAAAVAALAARAARRAEGTPAPPPLRALFLGRLDAQKGVDRLAAIIAATRGAPVQWRVVGRPVLDETPPDLGVEVEPPTSEPAALDALYAWADVLVLPSRFEGVPLVVLEAQRMGCAVLATDAGEAAEVVAHGEDGVLLPQSGRPEAALVADFAAHLLRLAAEPGPLLEVGRRAAARVAAAGGWEETMRGFLDHLDRVVPPR